jgi:quinol-cytochrome oxidoreductase complex cytochrome b subunit
MQQPSTPPPSTPPAGATQRPMGVTILVILAAILGVLGVIASLAVIGILGALGAGSFALLGLVGLAIAVLYLVFAYGAWNLQPWAWTLGVGLAAASIVLNLIGVVTQGQELVGTLISLAISGAILYYLFQPDVKAAFGRA